MSLKEITAELFGPDPRNTVRYAVVGLGDIAQEDMMPGIAHTGNSLLTALITSDPAKAQALGKKYQVSATYSYEQFPEALSSGVFHAIYLATPNWRHAEFIIPALRAGVHVLTEKPLEVSTAKCQEILEVARTSAAQLMVAYRLHFEPANLSTIDVIRSGKLGEVFLFSSTFTQPLDPANHRAHAGELAGPLFDMGPYPVNAARYVFDDEPTDVVSAVGLRHPESGFNQDFADTVVVTLRFPGERLAHFSISYFGGASNQYTAVGTKGSVTLDPAYTFGEKLVQTVVAGKEKQRQEFPVTDQFGGELQYFSDCILNDRAPEPDGEEGFADVRVLEGILQALQTGGSVKLSPFVRTKRIRVGFQERKLSPVAAPDLIHVASPTKGG